MAADNNRVDLIIIIGADETEIITNKYAKNTPTLNVIVAWWR